MRREIIPVRQDWQAKVESVGLNFHSFDGATYWDESVCYVLSAQEVDTLEAATNELHERCLEAAGIIIQRGWFERLNIPHYVVPEIIASWNRDDFSLYGRFDCIFDGQSPPKMLEYNADTPTALLEASVAQWFWLQDVSPQSDQFNSIHERLIVAWKKLGANKVHFASISDSKEDAQTTLYLQDTCHQAGKETQSLDMLEIGVRHSDESFVDADDEPIQALFKLYPWEWLWREDFSQYLKGNTERFIEPVWKMLLSNKGLLPILWELFPNHPNLLPCFNSPEPLGGYYVKKPKLSREGANITLFESGRPMEQTEGEYGDGSFVYQALAPRTDFHGYHPVMGLWIIDGESAGLGIREGNTRITDNASRFVPHRF